VTVASIASVTVTVLTGVCARVAAGGDGGDDAARELLPLPVSGHGGLVLVGSKASCARATGVPVGMLVLLCASSTTILFGSRRGGGLGGRRVLAGGSMVVPRAVAGFSW
jgi:hypothetical protein